MLQIPFRDLDMLFLLLDEEGKGVIQCLPAGHGRLGQEKLVNAESRMEISQHKSKTKTKIDEHHHFSLIQSHI